MTKKIPSRIRDLIKEGLAKCTPGQRLKFARMYAPVQYNKDDFLYNIDKLAEHNIDLVVDKMPSGKLKWALMQVQKTLNDNDE